MSILSFLTTPFSSDTGGTANNGRGTVIDPARGSTAAKREARGDEAKLARPAPAFAFLSYSRQDQGLVDALAAYLAQEEIPQWIDNQLQYGELWEEVIVQRIRDCTVFLIGMSPRARESTFVHREMNLALAERKLIVPILIEGEPFPQLESYQFVNLLDTDNPKTRFIERLRDLLAPGQVPSEQVQRRRVEHFALAGFEEQLEVVQGVRTMLGIGFDRHFNARPEQSLSELDELDWVEVFMRFRERLPSRDFHCPIGTDFKARFPTIRDFVEFVYQTLTWDEIRRL